MNIKQTVKSWAEMPKKREYEKKLSAMRGTYQEWIKGQDGSDDSGVSQGGGGDIETLRAEWEGATPLASALILYGDEDLVDEKGERHSPWFRPDWSPELLESCFYLGSVIGVQRDFLDKTEPNWKEFLEKYLMDALQESVPGKEAGGSGKLQVADETSSKDWAFFCNEAPDDKYQSLIRELCRKAGGWEKGCKTIAHVAKILHHCKDENGFAAFEKPALAGVMPDNEGETRTKEAPVHVAQPMLSVIIPSKDNPELLKACIQALKASWCDDPAYMDGPGRTAEDSALPKGALFAGGEGRQLEIIVVDNGSREENREQIAKALNAEGFQYLYQPMEFDFAKMCNMGAEKAKGGLLLFLNDDVELLPESHLDKMAKLARRPGVGAVGIKLLYPDSTRIQHAGITNLPMGPVHKLQFLDDGESYYHGLNRGVRNVLAVTAACLMVQAEKFRETGGFDETLKVAFNDVALCFRLYELGYRNVCMCDGFAYHHESMTRGSDDSQEKLERLLKERDRLYQAFPNLVGKDPYYSVHLGRQGLDVRVRPAYVTMKNQIQITRVRKTDDLSGYREDACLTVRIEDERDGEITGYIVVLGDDNACYEKKLLLQKESGEIYEVIVEPNYRPDLEENLPDQVDVALSGFWIRLDKDALPKGRYRIGGAVKRTVGRLCLISWSNRFLELI